MLAPSEYALDKDKTDLPRTGRESSVSGFPATTGIEPVTHCLEDSCSTK